MRPAGEIWQRAARALTGQAVTVYFGEPLSVGAAGQVYRDRDGLRIILDPELSGDPEVVIADKRRALLAVFLHECGHIADLGDRIAMVHEYKPRAYPRGPASEWTSPSEKTANRLALEWIGLAVQLAGGGKSNEVYLISLTKYFENQEGTRK